MVAHEDIYHGPGSEGDGQENGDDVDVFEEAEEEVFENDDDLEVDFDDGGSNDGDGDSDDEGDDGGSDGEGDGVMFVPPPPAPELEPAAVIENAAPVAHRGSATDGSATPRPAQRCAVSWVSLGGPKMWLFGGLGEMGEFYDDLWSYDTESRAWRQEEPVGAPTPTPQGPAAAAANAATAVAMAATEDAGAAAVAVEAAAAAAGPEAAAAPAAAAEAAATAAVGSVAAAAAAVQAAAVAGEAPAGQVHLPAAAAAPVGLPVAAADAVRAAIRMGDGLLVVPGRGPLPAARWGQTMVAYRGRAYMWGGTAPGAAYNVLWELDPSPAGGGVSDGESRPPTWRVVPTVGTPPRPRGGHSAAVVGSRMLIFGGNTTAVSYNDLFAIDLEDCKPGCGPPSWEELGGGPVSPAPPPPAALWQVGPLAPQPPPTVPKPAPRVGHCAVAMGERLFVYGGRNFITRRFAEGLACFDLARNDWRTLPHVAAAAVGGRRTGHAAVMTASGPVFWGGLVPMMGPDATPAQRRDGVPGTTAVLLDVAGWGCGPRDPGAE
ncbi:unnamed protein product [Phaeothamnion confervicola]